MNNHFVALIVNYDLNQNSDDGILWLNLTDITESSVAKEIITKYLHQTHSNELRWALKPVLISHLLNKDYERVFYCDSDIFFVNNPDFLIEDLKTNDILLFPHWQNISPSKPHSLISVLQNGYFNAGFIGATKKGLAAINWWAEACNFRMEKSETFGLFDDQKYLALVPFAFENVKIVTHKGCNLACWNIDTNKRELIDNTILINKEFPPVFIHFTFETINHVITGTDRLLSPFLDKYKQDLLEENYPFENLITNKTLLKGKSIFIKIKHKILLRTRIKRFLFWLSEKL